MCGALSSVAGVCGVQCSAVWCGVQCARGVVRCAVCSVGWGVVWLRCGGLQKESAIESVKKRLLHAVLSHCSRTTHCSWCTHWSRTTHCSWCTHCSRTTHCRTTHCRTTHCSSTTWYCPTECLRSFQMDDNDAMQSKLSSSQNEHEVQRHELDLHMQQRTATLQRSIEQEVAT